jgi:hypothetical protein
MTADDCTFGLAIVGYGLLATDFARLWRGRNSRALPWLTAAVVLAHVACVWALRFDWSLHRMLDKGIIGFVLFHCALVLVLLAPLLGGKGRRRTVTGAFVLVSAGALPAPFRYPELGLLALPLLAVFVAAMLHVVAGRPRLPDSPA